MITKEAMKHINRVVITEMFNVADTNRKFAEDLEDTWRAIRDTCKTENRLNDEGTTTKGMDIPESPNEVKNSDLLEKMLVLLGRVIDLERRIERTEKSVDALFRVTDSQKDSIRNLIDSVDMLLKEVREKC